MLPLFLLLYINILCLMDTANGLSQASLRTTNLNNKQELRVVYQYISTYIGAKNFNQHVNKSGIYLHLI
jgi:hypothetical protein